MLLLTAVAGFFLVGHVVARALYACYGFVHSTSERREMLAYLTGMSTIILVCLAPAVASALK